MTQLRYKLESHITPRGDIHLETTAEADDDLLSHRAYTIGRQLVDMQNKAVHASLVALGWTPPIGTPGPGRRIFPDPPADPVEVAAVARAIATRSKATLFAALVELGWTDAGHGIWKEPA